jgi:hypothetical protein
MKKIDRNKKRAEEVLVKIRSIARHIRNVEDNCLLLGEALILRGEIELGKQLIANGYVHDSSKFFGIEFEYMSPCGTVATEEGAKMKLKLALQHHNQTNQHHPEYWGNIHSMPDVAVAEMVCDWKSRSEEFGTNLRQWIQEEASKRFGFTHSDDVYKKIMEYTDIICQKPFENLNK